PGQEPRDCGRLPAPAAQPGRETQRRVCLAVHGDRGERPAELHVPLRRARVRLAGAEPWRSSAGSGRPDYRRTRDHITAMATTIDRIAHDAAQLLKVVGAVTGADGGPRTLLATLGWDLPPGVADIGLAQLDFSRVVQAVESVQEALSSNAS